jgi:hypothetical protein
VDGEHQPDGQREHGYLRNRDQHGAKDDIGGPETGGNPDRVRRVPRDQHSALQDEGKADRSDRRRQVGFARDRPKAQQVGADADRGTYQEGDEYSHRQRYVRPPHRRHRHHTGDHEHLAVGQRE